MITGEALAQAQAHAQPSIWLRLRWRWWRARTHVHLSSASVRKHWRGVFMADPVLLTARTCIHHRGEAGQRFGFKTMAGEYNARVKGGRGHMTEAQARRIYQGW